LDWTLTPESRCALNLHRDLLRLRREDAVLARVGTPAVEIQTSAPTPALLIVRYRSNDDERLLLLNLGERVSCRMNDPLLAAPAGMRWSPVWCSAHIDYGGRGIVETFGDGCWDLQTHCAWLLARTT